MAHFSSKNQLNIAYSDSIDPVTPLLDLSDSVHLLKCVFLNQINLFLIVILSQGK